MESITLIDIGMYLLIYSFLGWVAEAGFFAVYRQKFYNKGLLSLPLLMSYGISFTILILVLPTLGNNKLLQFIVTLTAVSVVDSICRHFFRYISPRLQPVEDRIFLFDGSGKGMAYALIISAVYYAVYLVLHPLVLALLLLIPAVVKKIIVIVSFVIIALDFIAVFYLIRSKNADEYRKFQEHGQQNKFASKLTNHIWNRLYKAYPEIRNTEGGQNVQTVFAKGLCFDKIIWIFFVSSLIGDIIETLYCGLAGGEWMSRSSVLYGPFSFVWGIGAVVLTMTLQKLAGKEDRYVFIAGFFIGGAYEYMCSVFTEIVFGTVFWDYSNMPLNIGGRTNVLYCFFWGILSVIWVKIVYPRMSSFIEKLPVIQGKVITWIALFFMLCNAALTCGAMFRYDTRQTRPEAANAFEAFLDSQYDDTFMENRWQNMMVTDKQGD